tara:strand:+ start:812 stop:1042 length:231 start_codon:yes stop_codon:yes gene_type:complete
MNKNKVKSGGGMKETIKGLVDIMENTVSEKVFNNTTSNTTAKTKPTVQVVTPSSNKYSSKDSFGDHHSQFTNLLNQ